MTAFPQRTIRDFLSCSVQKQLAGGPHFIWACLLIISLFLFLIFTAWIFFFKENYKQAKSCLVLFSHYCIQISRKMPNLNSSKKKWNTNSLKNTKQQKYDQQTLSNQAKPGNYYHCTKWQILDFQCQLNITHYGMVRLHVSCELH